MLTETQKNEMRENIARGIKYLDQVIPNWRSQIDWDQFRFESAASCIWGQLTDQNIGFRLSYPSPETYMGWNVPPHIHQEANCDDERHFTDDDVPRNICPYHFMHSEWLQQKSDVLPDGFKRISVSENWQAGVIFSKITHNLFGDDVKWLMTKIGLSIRPNEEWTDAYIREYGESPEKSFHCFIPEGM